MEKEGIMTLGLSDAYSILRVFEDARRTGIDVNADLYLRIQIAVGDYHRSQRDMSYLDDV